MAAVLIYVDCVVGKTNHRRSAFSYRPRDVVEQMKHVIEQRVVHDVEYDEADELQYRLGCAMDSDEHAARY